MKLPQGPKRNSSVRRFIMLCIFIAAASPLAIHVLYRIPAPHPFIASVWSPGELLDYVGSLLATVATIGTVILTIRFTRKESAEEHRLELMPYLVAGFNHEEEFSIPSGTVGYLLLQRDVEAQDADVDEDRVASGVIKLENVGNGAAVGFDISLREFDTDDAYTSPILAASLYPRLSSQISPGTTGYVSICIWFKYPSGLSVESDTDPAFFKAMAACKNFDFYLDIRYRDLLNNVYQQTLQMRVQTGIQNAGKGYRYCPEVFLVEAGDAVLL